MTADLKEAFHVAAVRFVGWRIANEVQSQWGIIHNELGRRAYELEPMVEFFGRAFSASEICAHAAVLNGPLPPHIRDLFVVIEDRIGDPIPETYPEAVEALEAAIDVEHDRQKEYPLTELPMVEKIRARSFEEGAAAIVKAVQGAAKA
ncbi:hypothetical protein ASG32_05330 [Methylobacterium sp. Leaf361]|uniref:hypothetical protein n=1 Tax=Methylobacterium sp. Leaf361 TaxID=1736352 RepID=UPI0006F9C62C|nr:hypothetical protein [Methylobacterium sp. Leaf361]KQS82152.1 hypothetical protein ASG32_05330 [Methylobacterium sp. Leaf361]